MYETREQSAVEGPVIPAGATVGAAPADGDDEGVRDIVAALRSAGHTPALLTEDYDTETCTADGFMISKRTGGRYDVFHLVNGQFLTDDRDNPCEVRTYRRALRDAGMTVERRDGPCAIVLLRSDASRPPVTVVLDAMKNRKLADPEHVAEILARRCQHCQGAGCPECSYKPYREADSVNPEPAAPTVESVAAEGKR